MSGNEARVAFCERDQGLELVTARFAFPEMPHTMSRQVLGPFRQEDRVSTLGAMIEGSSLGVFSGARGSELHDVFPPVFFLTSLPLPDAEHRRKMPGNKAATLT